MCYVPESSRSLATATGPHHAGCKKRPREQDQPATTLALYDPSTADKNRAKNPSTADAGALVPFLPPPVAMNAVPLRAVAPPPKNMAPDAVPLCALAPPPKNLAHDAVTLCAVAPPPKNLAHDAVTLCAVAPPPKKLCAVAPPPKKLALDAVPLRVVAPPPKKLAPDVARAEPPWLRRGLLAHLRFRLDLPVYFIDEKTVTATDLDRHQNRFRLPSEGVLRNLRPVLTPLQCMAANLVHEEAPKPPKQDKVPGEKAKKRKGKKHGGLPVLVVEPGSGISELQLSRWDSSGGTVIKGEGYLNFINNSGFEAGDVVEIWAFKESYFRLMGKVWLHDSPLYLLITKKGQMLPRQ